MNTNTVYVSRKISNIVDEIVEAEHAAESVRDPKLASDLALLKVAAYRIRDGVHQRSEGKDTAAK